MSNNSWKQYGGMSKIDKFQHLTIGTLVADQVLLREKVSTVSTFTTSVIVQGSLAVNVDISGVNLNATNNLNVTNDATIGGKINIGSINNYLYATNNGIGINNNNPSATLDIYGNLIVRSGTTYIRNIIAQNSNNKGIAVIVNNNSSYIDFFNTTNTSNINTPNSRISTYDNTFQLDTSNIIMNSTTSKLNSLSTIDICSNIIGNIKAGSTLNILSNSKININANTLLDIISPNSTIYSRLHVTNRDVSSNIFDETMVVYDISSGKYLYDIYENNNTTGHALTLVSNNNSSNTFMKIVSPNKSGLGIGGGTYSNDNNRAMGIIGLSKSDGNFIPIQNIVSGNTKVKYYATVGINKHSPVTEKYVMDINGAIRITNGEINKVQDISFQILNVAFSKINKLFGIAVGTPSSINSPFTQNIYYTNDGGLNWNLSLINNNSTGLASSVKNLYVNVYNNDYSVIGANNTNLLYSIDGGISWSTISITGLANNNNYNTIKSVFVSQKPNDSTIKRIFLAFDTSFGYVDSDNSTFNTISGLSANTISSINYVDGNSNYIYYVGNGIQRYNISSNNIDNRTNNDTDISYNHINVLDNSYSIAVGVKTISYTTNGGDSWTSITITNTTFNSVFIYDEKRAIAVGNNGVLYYTNNGYSTWNIVPDILLNSGGNANILNGSSVTLRSIYMPDINSFVMSKNIQSYITNSQLGLSKIYYCYLPNLFNRSQNNVIDISGSIQIGGDLNINDGGNLYVNQDSRLNGNLFVNYDTLLNSRLNIGSDITTQKRLFTIGDVSLNGNLFVNYDTSLNSRLYIGSDITTQKRLFTIGDTSLNGNLFVNYDTSLNSRLYIGSDTTINKRLFTIEDVIFSGSLYVSKDTTIIGNLNVSNRIINNADVIMRSSLFVDYDASINRSVFIGKDLTVNGNLSVKKYKNENIINTTINTYNLIISEDISLNGRLHTSGDVSLNGNLYLAKSMNINTTNNITNALVNINGNMITNYIGINTTNVNTNRALDINGNLFQYNGCIFQF
jgi:hypothetical protein